MNLLIAKLRAKWDRKHCQPTPRAKARRDAPMKCELLESRCVPAVVTTLSDAALHAGVSLRDALASTSSGGTITFASGLLGAISLRQGELAVPNSVTIKGPRLGIVAIDAHGASRIFDLTGSTETVTISGLTLENGSATGGGAILFADPTDKVTISGAVLKNNQSTGNGGAIDGQGTLTLQSSTLSGNSATGGGMGGGSYVNGTAAVTYCTFTNNYAVNGGGLNVVGAVTIRGSKFTGNTSFNSGAAAGVGGEHLITPSQMSVFNSTFTGNHAGFNGGAIGDDAGTLTLGEPSMLSYGGPILVTNCTVSNNTAGNNGGAIASGDTSRGLVTIIISKISGNHAGNVGGGVYSAGGVTLRTSIISGSRSGNVGGGVDVIGVFTVQNSTISGNSASYLGGGVYETNLINGGGVYDSSVLNASNSTFANNHANVWGGGMFLRADATIQACTISGNTATNSGGGIVSYALTLKLVNSTVVSNTTGLHANPSLATLGGGGIELYAGCAATIENSTIAFNRVSITGSAGGGILVADESVLTITSSIVANNHAPRGNDIRIDPTSAALASFCLIQDSFGLILGPGSGNNIFHLDPHLGPLANNGGPTLTMQPAVNSPVVGHGSNPDNLPTEQRGFPRSTNGLTDIGAVQVEPVVPSTGQPGHRGQRP
jgi:predicted outer membrane repeat protein